MIRPISRTAFVLDIVAATALFLVLTPVSFAFSAPQTNQVMLVAMVIASLLMFCAVATGRLAPGVALLLAWAGAIIQMAASLPPLPINFGILLVVYATAAWGSTRVHWWGLASAISGGLIAAIYSSFMFAVSPAVATLLAGAIILALGFAWVAGLLWRLMMRSQRIRAAQALAEEATVEEQERVRIARDMHDIVAHSLAVVIAQADGARYVAASNPDMAADALGTIAQTARAALSDVRILLTQLRHRQGEGPQPTLADLEALFNGVRQSGVEPRVTIDPMPPGEPPAAIQLAVYRILQEAVTNAIRHGENGVDVRIAWHPDRVDLEVSNAVRGEHAIAAGGHGIIGMRERAQLVGGRLQATNEGAQFVVRATLPIGETE